MVVMSLASDLFIWQPPLFLPIINSIRFPHFQNSSTLFGKAQSSKDNSGITSCNLSINKHPQNFNSYLDPIVNMAANLVPSAVTLVREEGDTSSAGLQEIVMLYPNYPSFRQLRDEIKGAFEHIEKSNDHRDRANIPDRCSWSTLYKAKKIIIDWNPPSSSSWDGSASSYLGAQYTILTEHNWKAAYQKFVQDKNPTARIVVILAKPATPLSDFVAREDDLEKALRV